MTTTLKSRPAAAALGLVAAAILSLACSCGSTEPRVCTQIGCDSGLLVQVQGNVPDQLTISVRPRGSPQAWTVQCTTATCARYVFFADFTPEAVYVEVHGAGVDIVREMQPAYVVERPNGKDCPPECRIGKVVLQVS